jgi:hypothetical protein
LSPSKGDFVLSGGDGIYKLSWPELQIDIDVDRIRTDREHQVKAEVNVTSGRPNSSGHLRNGRLTLNSPSNKKSLVKSLEDRDSEIDWDTVIEQLCTSVLQQHRLGPIPVEITGDTDVKATDKWLIEPMLQTGHPSLIYGQGSAGKSWLAQYISVLADAGMSATGLRVEPARVLYLDWETTQEELGIRVAMLRKGLGLQAASHIWYREMSTGLTNDVEQIRHIIMDKEIDLLVLDSLGAACMGEPSNEEVVINMFASLRSLKRTSLCIDHVNKDGGLYGSNYKFINSRQIWEIKKKQEEDEESFEFALFHRKANNSKLTKPMGWQLSFTEDSALFKRKDVRDTALEPDLRIVDRIENLLRHEAMVPKDIAEELEKEPSHIRKELHDWTARGKFIKLDDGSGRYALPVRKNEWGSI